MVRAADAIPEVQLVVNRSRRKYMDAHAANYDILMFRGASEHSMGLFIFDMERN